MKPEDAFTWRSALDGPWPEAFVGGELERAEAEWLLTNGVGTYAMSTLALMHTRRHHGLLVGYVHGQRRRHVILSHLEMTLESGGRTHRLSTHQFPNVAPTLGYRALTSFTQDPLPRWVFRLPTGTVERTVSLVEGKQAVVVALTWSGKQAARVTLRPLMPMRPADELCREHGSMLQRVVLRGGEVEVQPVLHLPPVTFWHAGIFMGSPDWWRKFEYLADRGRYVDFQEDMWSPGVFEITLESRQTAYLVAYTGEAPTGTGEELVMAAAQARLACDPDPSLAPEVRALSVAVEAFVFKDGEGIFAGYPWLDAWSRDTLLSIRGTYLARDQLARAKKTFLGLLDRLEGGLLPQRLVAAETHLPVSADATLWLFDVGKVLVDASPDDSAFSAQVLSALGTVFRRIVDGPREFLWLGPHGMLENGASYPLTWMDSRTDAIIHAPRWGLAVELQALWYRACDVVAALCESGGQPELADRARELARRLASTFGTRFWCHDSNYPFDCISAATESTDAWADAAVRPNALIALAVAPALFAPWQRQEIVARVEERLLTPHGLRTLDPQDSRYVGHAGGTIAERSRASHLGAVWPHLLLYYVQAALAEGASAADLRELVRGALIGGQAVGHVAQAADGDAPHHRRGSPAYAIATSMLLEALVLELRIGVEGRTLW